MSRFSFTLACLMAAGLALSAHADTTYTATGTLAGVDTTVSVNGVQIQTPVTGQIEGTVNVSDAGVIDSETLVLVFNDGLDYDITPQLYVPSSGSAIDNGQIPGISFSSLNLPFQNNDEFFLDIVTPLSGPYQGGAMCDPTNCGGAVTIFLPSFDPHGPSLGPYTLVSGELVAPQVTPEPSSLVLLGTGLLGAIGATRRRFLRA